MFAYLIGMYTHTHSEFSHTHKHTHTLSLSLLLCTFFQLAPALPDPFPIPMLKVDIERSLSEKKLCADDRKYIVRVLATVLLTFKTH